MQNSRRCGSNFKVCVRIRPESEREQRSNHHLVVDALDQNVLVFDPKKDATPTFDAVTGQIRKNPRVLQKRERFVDNGGGWCHATCCRDIKFAFDRVFAPDATQADIFEFTAKYDLHMQHQYE